MNAMNTKHQLKARSLRAQMRCYALEARSVICEIIEEHPDCRLHGGFSACCNAAVHLLGLAISYRRMSAVYEQRWGAK